MIQVKNLTKSFGSDTLFNDASFTINKREKVGLIGRNGYGKTTLFGIILGNIEPEEGTIEVPSDYRIGYVQQHISFSQDTVLQEACLGLAPEEKDDHWKVKKVLSGIGFSEDQWACPPVSLSGGYKIRLHLAKVLVSNADLLLLDEPNNYLDIIAIRWLIGFLKSWPGELLLITHDRYFMDSIITHTICIHRKMFRKMAGTTEKMYSQIFQEEDIYERTRLNDEKQQKKTELFIRRFRAKARLAGMVQSRIKTLEKKEKKEKLEKIETLDFSFHAAPFHGQHMMSAHDISFSYEGGLPYLIDALSFSIKKKDRICVIGKNGKGKSTLLKILAGILSVKQGTIKQHPQLSVGYYHQTDMLSLHDDNTIVDEIKSADPGCLVQRIRAICGTLMFSGDHALKKIRVLSGGEKSRVLLGKILVKPCHLLLLDEPTNHLDLESCEALADAVDEFDGAVVMVTHNEMYLHSLATSLIVFDNNTVRFFPGSYQEFLNHIGWQDERDQEKYREGKMSGSRLRTFSEKKAFKQKKAELINQRSQALKPLKSRIEKLEQAIQALETEKHHVLHQMIHASTEKNPLRIKELAQQNSALADDIEQQYEELYAVTETYEQLAQEYEQKLAELLE